MLKKATTIIDGICMVLFMLSLFFFVIKNGYCGESMGIIEDVRKIELKEIKCDEQNADYFGYIKGHIPILISAPHGAKHYRLSERRWKGEDAYTSSFAIKLGELTGAYVVYARNKSNEDPNSDIHCRYKDFLRRVVEENGIKFIVDIHGASRDRKFKIDVGIMDNLTERSSCPTFKPVIERAFRDFDEGTFNKHFSAKGLGTITYFARNDLGIEAAQFEINALYRIMESRSNSTVRAKEQDVLDIMGRMQGMISDINDKIARDFSANQRTVSKLQSSP
jgi:predicted component of type VI protein secretion system